MLNYIIFYTKILYFTVGAQNFSRAIRTILTKRASLASFELQGQCVCFTQRFLTALPKSLTI